MSDTTSTRSITIQRTLRAGPSAVFNAFVKPALVEQWMKCDGDVKLQLELWDTQEGGRFCTMMSLPGQWEANTDGHFTEIVPDRLFAYESDANAAMNMPAMSVRAELESIDTGTKLTVTHAGIPTEELRTTIRGGWTASLSLLDALLQQSQKAK